MNCRDIQELLLTDYLDARLPDGRKSLVDSHLHQCTACAAFWAKARAAVDPLKSAPGVDVGPALWTRIKEGISAQEEQKWQKALTPGFVEKLHGLFHVPRPVYVLATVVLLFVMVGLPSELAMFSPKVASNGLEQAQYLSSLVSETSDNTLAEATGPIENYFL